MYQSVQIPHRAGTCLLNAALDVLVLGGEQVESLVGPAVVGEQHDLAETQFLKVV